MIARKIIPPTDVLSKYSDIIRSTETLRSLGTVRKVMGRIIYSHGPDASLGEICYIEGIEESRYIEAEVIGFEGEMMILSPYEEITGIFPGTRIVSSGKMPSIRIDNNITGRVMNGVGVPLDSKNKFVTGELRSFNAMPPNPLHRKPIETVLPTGVRAIDGFLTVGHGQRLGIFAGSGVGKSTLLGMIARYAQADVNVIGLIGERGREVNDFIRNELGENGLKKSVVVVSSSNESAIQRVRAAYLVTTLAEYFRDQGKKVLLMMDSLTRLAMAQREIGLGRGEPAATRGYTPSVFQMMPELLERAGNSDKGSITGVYTVLVEGDDLNDPIADTARGILDGHIVLSRSLAEKNHYPPIDVRSSISRVMSRVLEKDQFDNARSLRETLAEYANNEQMINIGAYARGSSSVIDTAIRMNDPLNRFLRQSNEEATPFNETSRQLKELVNQMKGTRTGQTNLRRVV